MDVNVHPTKTEIRFLNSRDVFSAVHHLLASLIVTRGAPGFVPQSHQFERPIWKTSEPVYQHQPSLDFRAGFTPSVPVASLPSHEPGTETTPATQPEVPSPRQHDLVLLPSQFLGIGFNTYLFYDLGDQLVLIDQHAAHERVRYERLKNRVFSRQTDDPPPSQALLIPEAVRFAAADRTRLENRLEWLERIGFEAEIFGEESLLFRSVPTEWGTRDLRTRLKNLVEKLMELEIEGSEGSQTGFEKNHFMDEALFEKLASEACHSAVRAGDRLEKEEALALVDQLFRCEHPWNCPHGRPTVVKVPQGKIEEWFQRRV